MTIEDDEVEINDVPIVNVDGCCLDKEMGPYLEGDMEFSGGRVTPGTLASPYLRSCVFTQTIRQK